MQAAVDIVAQSPHPTNKIAATIAGDGWAFSRTNHWPAAIETTIGRDTDIGNSSGTIHAETACIFAAYAARHATRGASIFITDPPCPNCMKNIAEAGITKLYIDHKGFDKDWAKRRSDQFENMSLRIAAKAAIDVYVIYRKEQRFEIISKHAPNYKPAESHPPIIHPLKPSSHGSSVQASNTSTRLDHTDKPCDDENWKLLINKATTEYKNEPFATALATNQSGETIAITATLHPTIGYTPQDPLDKEGKYSFILQPLNRLLMIAAREGLSLSPNHIYSSRCPSSRELINFIGAGFTTLQIGNKQKARDQHGLLALEQLEENKTLNVIPSEVEGSNPLSDSPTR